MASVYQIVTGKIIEELEKGIVPWQKPWFGKKINYVTRKPYRGVNLLLLPKPGEYLTWKQVQSLGGKVKKGAKAYLVVFWKKYIVVDGKYIESIEELHDVDTENESYDVRFVLRYYKVFHIDDVEGVQSKIYREHSKGDYEKAKNISQNYLYREGVKLLEVEYNTRSYYDISRDEIVLPLRKFFISTDYYYQVLFHEIIHSTGHPKRLHRYEDSKEAVAFGTKAYSKEELTAELGSAFLMSLSGLVPTYKNSAAYIQSWLQVLRNDRRFIISAAAKAQEAAEYVCGSGL